MSCGCGRSPDFCRGWHALTEEEWQEELAKFRVEEQQEAKSNTKYHEVTVLEVHHTTPSLFKIRTTKPEGYAFKPGEFTMIGLPDSIKRAYSFTSAPSADYLEFYSIKAPNGELTSLLKYVLPGDTMHVGKKAKGTLLAENFTPQSSERVWLLATGTGIAPFMSILRSRQLKTMFERKTYVMWSVRKKEDLLAYDEELTRNSFIHYIPIVTQDAEHFGWTKRIQEYLLNPELDGLSMIPELDPIKDRVMLCGSMEFNEDLREILEERGFVEGSNQQQGTYVLEKAFVG